MVKKLFFRVFQTFSKSSMPVVKKDNSPSKSIEEIKKLTDVEYESLFLELAEGVHQGWSQEQVKEFFDRKNFGKSELLEWLQNVSIDVSDEFPDEYVALSNKGTHLSNSGRNEEALLCFERALEINRDDFLLWYNRAVTLKHLKRYEEALYSYDQVLAIKPDFYQVWEDYGHILDDLRRYEEALYCYNKALEINPEYEIAWNNFGALLRNLKRYEEALYCYDKLLGINPNYYTAWGNHGGVLGCLDRYEEAILSFDKALAIKPDLYEIWINRGYAARRTISCDPFLSFQSSIAKKNLYLNQRGYEGALASYEEGLKYCPQDKYPKGWGRLQQEIGNEHYFRGKIDLYPRPYWRKAVKSYHQALETATVKDSPELHLDVLRGLIRVYLSLGETEQAEELQRRGVDVLQLLLDECPSPGIKQQLALKFVGFQQLTVDLAVQSGKLIEALKVAEHGKNTCLSWILYGFEEEISAPKWEEIQQKLLNQNTAIIYWHLSPASLHVFILKHEAEYPILVTAPISTEEEQRSESLHCLNQFEDWVNHWNQEYDEYRSKAKKSQQSKNTHSWRTKMGQQLTSLQNILNIQEIEQHLRGIEQLILIPHRDLHRFPLHALFSAQFEITYLPSIQMGLSLQKVQREEGVKPSLLSVAASNSEGLKPLYFSLFESAVVSQQFSHYKRFQEEEATKEQVTAELANSYNAFHFAGHGLYNFHDPKSSELALSGKDRLTLAEIRQKNLSHYQLVTLSACETAITGNQSITTEYVGLVSGFLSMGVSHVVSTLWTVESAASALVMIEFYRRWQAGTSKAKALAEVTCWLRNLTVGQLQQWYKALLSQLSPEDELRSFTKSELRKLGKMEKDRKLYEHPYYWAAFIITGNIELI